MACIAAGVDGPVDVFNAFRVVAPPAGQRAPFHENRGTDARPVMYGIPFDIEYETRRHDNYILAFYRPNVSVSWVAMVRSVAISALFITGEF